MSLPEVLSFMKVFLETERLILRYFQPGDESLLWELDSNPEVMRYINNGQPPDLTVITQKTLPGILSFYEEFEHFGFWAVHEKLTQAFIGWLHFFPAIENALARELNLVTDGEIALGYRFKQEFWGKGYATEGASALVKMGFEQADVSRVVAWALKINYPSIHVMEKVGLTLEREFEFTTSQLPYFSQEERQSVKYGMSREAYFQHPLQLLNSSH